MFINYHIGRGLKIVRIFPSTVVKRDYRKQFKKPYHKDFLYER